MSDYALYQDAEYLTLILRDGKVYCFEKGERMPLECDMFELNPNVTYDCLGEPLTLEEINDKMLKEIMFNLIIL